MIRAIGPFIACAMMMAVVACGGRDPVAKEAKNTAGLPEPNEPMADVSGSPPTDGSAQAASTPSEPGTKIPATLHGRWGLSPLDCTTTKGDAKGLLVITPDGLQFYESRAVPSASAQASSDSISGDFDFTGEGQRWTKYEALEVRKDELVRTESNPMASFTYAKCK